MKHLTAEEEELLALHVECPSSVHSPHCSVELSSAIGYPCPTVKALRELSAARGTIAAVRTENKSDQVAMEVDVECRRDGTSGPTCHKHTYEALVQAEAREKTQREALEAFSLWLEQECKRGTLNLGFGPDWSAKKVQLALDRVLAGTDKPARAALNPCEHEWVDARNEVVKSGKTCLKCGAIRAALEEE